MRQALDTPNPQQKFPDRLGGDHASVIYSAEQRRAIIATIAIETYIRMGYPLRANSTEREEVIAVWCEAFDCIPDTRLDYIHAEGKARSARTPDEYVAIFEEEETRLFREKNTRRILKQYADDRKNAVPAGEESPGKAYAMRVWREAGILK